MVQELAGEMPSKNAPCPPQGHIAAAMPPNCNTVLVLRAKKTRAERGHEPKQPARMHRVTHGS